MMKSVQNRRAYATPTIDPSEYPWADVVETPEILERDASTRFAEHDKAQAWGQAARIVNTYSDDIVKRLNAEIDALLVYAGLFSAVITAFNVESYGLLQPQSPDASLAVLERISAQLSASSTNAAPLNVNRPLSELPSTSASPVPVWTIWLNILWFSSLICSLAAASIGITVKQWLQEYSSGLSGASRHTARLRQRRLNSLAKWRVADITAALPVMLQLALAFYSIGLLVLLWNLHLMVAAIATSLVGLLFFFSLASCVLPLLHDDCSYLSTQSLALYALWIKIFPPCSRMSYKAIRSLVLAAYRLTGIVPARICRRLSQLPRVSAWSQQISRLQERPELPRIVLQTWRGREHTTVNDLHGRLDADMLAQAFDVSLDEDCLDVAAVGITELARPDVLHCCESLSKSLAKHVKTTGPEGIHPLVQRHRFWTSLVMPLCTEPLPTDRMEWLAPSGAVVFRQRDIKYGLIHSFLNPGDWKTPRYDSRDLQWLDRVLTMLVHFANYERSPLTMMWASYALCTWKRPRSLEAEPVHATRGRILSAAREVISRMSSDLNFMWPNVDDDTLLGTHVSAVGLIWSEVARSRRCVSSGDPHQRLYDASRERLWAFGLDALAILTERLKLATGKPVLPSPHPMYGYLMQLLLILDRPECTPLLSPERIEALQALPCFLEAEGTSQRLLRHKGCDINLRLRKILRFLKNTRRKSQAMKVPVTNARDTSSDENTAQASGVALIGTENAVEKSKAHEASVVQDPHPPSKDLPVSTAATVTDCSWRLYHFPFLVVAHTRCP
ncbi:hypothetical protein OH77DRAFT_974560 [Trametes cingulata]|nr:hypothetical protein OH77DRAFT_974560 [Trametes cingulata]